MRVALNSGDVIELGSVEAAPTIGITDYSRRVTDDYGVTTVVERGFARRMSVRLAVPFTDADAVQRRLAELRATPATWIADDRYASLTIEGFFKEFELDLAVPPLAYCTLTVEGLAESGGFVDVGGDPAVEGASTLRLVDPVVVDDAVLVSSSVAEDDAPTWAAGATYAKGARVIKAASHRIYESLVDANTGADPAASPASWLDVGPTGRWAMFDQALGTSTIDDRVVEIVLRPLTAVTALAVLDTNAATVRATAPGYDRTIAVNDAGKALFLDIDLPAGTSITVRLTPAEATAGPRRWDDGASWLDEGVWRDSLAAGDGTVTIGTMLVGAVRRLGVTEASPTAGIIDYSRKVTDEFGETTVVPRAWAKRMAAKALIRSNAVDLVAGRLASVRARPVLWLGAEGIDSLTVYGFFKDFSIEIGETVSKLSLTIEGLSTAAKLAPIGGTTGPVDWTDLTDKTGKMPTDNADKTSENTAKDTAAIGGTPTKDFLDAYAAAKARQDALENDTIPAINKAVADAGTRITAARNDADVAIAAANRRITDASTVADDAVTAANVRITANRVILDGALSDLAAEVDRSQGADEELSRRIDTISATGGYDDTQVRSLITSVDTARADDKRAIGQRVDSVTTDYQNRDRATNTRIDQTATAFSDADRAIGQRIDSVVTDYKGLNSATGARITSEVAALSDADTALGRRIDTLIAEGGGGSDGVDTVARSEVSRVEQASISRDGALGQRIDTVTTDFRTLNTATNARIDSTATTLSDADRALGSRIDTVSATFRSGKGLTPNADFAAGDAGWSATGFTFPSYGGGKLASSNPGVYCQLNTVGRTKVVDTSRAMRMHCVFKVFGAAQLTYVGMQMYDSTGAHIGNVYAPGFAQVLAPGTYSVDQLYVGQWPNTALPLYTVGDKFIPTVNSVNPLFLANYPDAGGPFAGGYVQIESFWIEEVGTAQLVDARVSSVATTLADADRALGQRIDTVTSDYKSLNTATNTRITTEVSALSAADIAAGRRSDTLEAQMGGTAGSGLQTLIKNNRKNLIDVGWWKRGAALPWPLNGGRENQIYPLPDGVGNWDNIKAPDGSSGDVWLCRAASGGEGTACGGWNGGPIAPLDPDKTYRFMVPIAALGGAGQRSSYWGTSEVCGLNTTADAPNPYFAASGGLPVNRWLLFVGFIFPRNSTGKTHDGAGIYDTTTGERLVPGTNYCFYPDGRQPIHRAYQYYATDGAYQAFGRPIVELVDGTETNFPAALANAKGLTQATARIASVETVATDAKSAVANLSTSVNTRFGGVNDTLSAYDQRISTLSTGSAGFASRATTLEAQMNRTAASPLNSYVDAVNGRIDTVNSGTVTTLSARIKSSEDALADLPNRYAAASRASTLEAQVARQIGSPINDYVDYTNRRVDDVHITTVPAINARIEDRASAIADAKTGAVAQTVQTLRSEYNGTVATVSQQAGTIAGLNNKAVAYVKLVADAGGGRAALSLWSDQFGGAWSLTGDGQIDGNLTVNGSITARKFNGASMAKEVASGWTGGITPAAGQAVQVPWSLSLPVIPAGVGRLQYTVLVGLTTNANTMDTATYNGLPLYTHYVDSGGFALYASDPNGNTYNPRAGGYDRNLSSVDWSPTFYASVRRGNANNGQIISQGDYYERFIDATYTLNYVTLTVLWVAI